MFSTSAEKNQSFKSEAGLEAAHFIRTYNLYNGRKTGEKRRKTNQKEMM